MSKKPQILSEDTKSIVEKNSFYFKNSDIKIEGGKILDKALKQSTKTNLEKHNISTKPHAINQEGLQFLLNSSSGKDCYIELLEYQFLAEKGFAQKEIDSQKNQLNQAIEVLEKEPKLLVFKNYYFSSNSTFKELCDLLKILGSKSPLVQEIANLLKAKNKKCQNAFKLAVSLEQEREYHDKEIHRQQERNDEIAMQKEINFEQFLEENMEKFLDKLDNQEVMCNLFNRQLKNLNAEIERDPQAFTMSLEKLDKSQEPMQIARNFEKSYLIFKLAQLHLKEQNRSNNPIEIHHPALHNWLAKYPQEKLEKLTNDHQILYHNLLVYLKAEVKKEVIQSLTKNFDQYYSQSKKQNSQAVYGQRMSR